MATRQNGMFELRKLPNDFLFSVLYDHHSVCGALDKTGPVPVMMVVSQAHGAQRLVWLGYC